MRKPLEVNGVANAIMMLDKAYLTKHIDGKEYLTIREQLVLFIEYCRKVEQGYEVQWSDLASRNYKK